MTNNTGKYYTTSSNYTDHSCFRGKIYLSDFETDYPNTMADIASRIMSDRKFDEQCRKSAESRDRKKNFKKGN